MAPPQDTPKPKFDWRTKVLPAWLKALRSGDYHQGMGKLRIDHGGGNYEYCCLGVLEDVVCKLDNQNHERFWGQRATAGLLRPETISRISTDVVLCYDPIMHYTEDGKKKHCTLAGLNDDYKYGFERIADIIEEHYKLH